ncbi:MAG: hypothetical protein WC761_03365 [Candidatus Paceibacterota bacterium]|jgi:hypothetical protein
MVEAKEIIEERLRELEAELEKHDQTDFLSREIIEADIEKVNHILETEEKLS